MFTWMRMILRDWSFFAAAAALMNTGVICDVTFCRLVNIYDVSKDHAAFIYEVTQSKREILDSLTV